MKVLATDHQKKLPFYITYGVLLKAELGGFKTAFSDLDTLDETLVSKPYALGSIYFRMDGLKLAKQYIDKAVSLDKNHLIAQGLKITINKRLK
jgi:hypothetical protein